MGALTDSLADVNFLDFIDALFRGGWFDFVFPFLLIYAVVFTILQNVKIFEDKKSVRIIIALVFGLFAIAFPITGDLSCNIPNAGVGNGGYYNNGCQTLGSLMMTLFPGVSAFSIGILGLYIVIGMLGIDVNDFLDGDSKKYVTWILGALGLFVVIYYYALGFGWDGFDGNNWLWGYDGILRDSLLYILLVFGFLFFWVTKEDDNSGSKGGSHSSPAHSDSHGGGGHH